jgi:hypothetical protein
MFAHSIFTKSGAEKFEGRLDIHGISPIEKIRMMHRVGPAVGMLETKYIFDDEDKLNVEYIAFCVKHKDSELLPPSKKRKQSSM